MAGLHRLRGWAMVTRDPVVAPLMQALAHAAGRVIAEEKAILRDGSAIVVRPLATGDVTAITTWFEGLGPTTRYARFLGFIDRLDDRWLSLLAQVDHQEHEALTAVTPEGATIGIARYIRLQGTGTAELAVAVADRWAGHGIASLLLERIAAQARAAGIDRLTALCLSSNEAMLHLFTKIGPTSIISPPDAAGAVEVHIDLGPVSVTARHQRGRPDVPAG
jgi:GNAT superfamily N-acetyltransferase